MKYVRTFEINDFFESDRGYNEADRLISLTFFTFSRRGILEQDRDEQRDRKLSVHIANPTGGVSTPSSNESLNSEFSP